MKNIAIFAPFHFSNYQLLNETLDSITISGNDVLLCSETSSITFQLKKYADEKELYIHLFQTNWNRDLAIADKIRDEEMIDNAHELILFNDGTSKKIDLLRSYAIQIGIAIHEIKIIPQKWEESTEYIKLNKLNSFDELHSELQKLTLQNDKSISEMNYETAALIRDKIRYVNEKLEMLD